MTDEQRLQMITEQLLIVRDNLFRGMSKSIQRLQARSINEVIELENFTQSPQHTWVGLTDDEIQKCWKAAIKLNSEKSNDITNQTFYHLVKIVEEELMEKNYG